MKLSEMAKKAKEKLIGALSGSRKEENGQETAEMTAQKAQEGQQDEKTDISAHNAIKGQETAKTEPTGQEETVLGIDMATGRDMTGYNVEAVSRALEKFAESMEEIMKALETICKAGMTETQIRKMELWKRYYEEKAKMSNNERRRRGIPMVRRPKRQQYRTKKPDLAAAGSRQREKSEKAV